MMARVTTLIDDIDGTEGATTIKWTHKGVPRSLDLSAEHEAQFDADMAKWNEIADRIKEAAAAEKGREKAPMPQPKGVKTSGRRKKSSGPKPSEQVANDEIRAWANANGHSISDRGRVPQDIKDAFDAAVDRGELELTSVE